MGPPIANEPRAPNTQTLVLKNSLAIAALVLVLFGSKVLFIRYFGSVVPFWDQWDAEADILYKSYLNSKLTFATLIQPHNEHRIFFTRVLSLILFELDGGWDPILQMIVDSVLHIAAIVVLVRVVQPILRPERFLPFVLFSMLLFALPFGWENLLSGFQSQFYFLLLFSGLALRGFAVSRGLSLGWWASLVATIACYFSLASGVMTAAVAIAVVGAQMVLGLRRGPRELVAVTILSAVLIAMILYLQQVEGHAIYKSHNVGEFLRALVILFAFPYSNAVFAVILNLPLIAFIGFVLTTRPSRSSPHWAIVGVSVWVLTQAIALSYGRAVLIHSSRYADLLVITLPLNFGILLFAIDSAFPAGRSAVVLRGAMLWLVLVVPGLVSYMIGSSLPEIIKRGERGREHRTTVVEFLRTGDIAPLEEPQKELPFPNAKRLAFLLSDPIIRLELPEAIRPADIKSEDLFARTYLKGRLRPVVERFKSAALDYDSIIAAIGLALAFAACLIQARSTRVES